MTLQDEYTTTARRTQDLWVDAVESWTQGIHQATDHLRVPAVPVVPAVKGDPTVVVDRYFTFVGRLLEANREYAKNLAGAANAYGDAVRQHVDSVSEIVRGEVETATSAAKEQIETLGQVARDQADRAEQAAEQAEKEQARQAREAARERYESLTKAELAEELAKRDLPKTGNVDELVERLVDADNA